MLIWGSNSHASHAYLSATMNCAGGHDKVKIKCKIGVPDSVRFWSLLASQYFPLSCSSNCQNSSQYWLTIFPLQKTVNVEAVKKVGRIALDCFLATSVVCPPLSLQWLPSAGFLLWSCRCQVCARRSSYTQWHHLPKVRCATDAYSLKWSQQDVLTLGTHLTWQAESVLQIDVLCFQAAACM